MLGNISVSCSICVCPAYGIVCQQTVSYAKHTENVAQQPDLIAAVNIVCEQMILYVEHTENIAHQSNLFAAVNAVCCTYGKLCSVSRFVCCGQIYLLQSMSSVSRRFRMLSIRKTLHSNQIYLLQSMSYAEHTENSVPYPDFLLRSFSHFESFLTADQPFLVDNYCDSHWARLPSQEAAA